MRLLQVKTEEQLAFMTGVRNQQAESNFGPRLYDDLVGLAGRSADMEDDQVSSSAHSSAVHNIQCCAT